MKIKEQMCLQKNEINNLRCKTRKVVDRIVSNDIFMLGFTPELEKTLHWNNSSNVLCNYMKKQEYLDMVLRNKEIIPRYVIEPVEYLRTGEIKKICKRMSIGGGLKEKNNKIEKMTKQ